MHSLSAVIRPFHKSDVPVVVEIAKKSMEYPWSNAVFCDCLKANYHAWILMLEKPIGFLVVLDKMDECELLNIGVLPEYQRQGYGQQLLAHAMAYAETKNFKQILLEVRVSNKKAISLYHAAGFINVGIRKNYYPIQTGREDAILMSLKKLLPRR